MTRFEIRKRESSNFVILFQDYIGFVGTLKYPHEFWYRHVDVHKKARENVERNCIEFVDQFGEYCYLNIKTPDP